MALISGNVVSKAHNVDFLGLTILALSNIAVPSNQAFHRPANLCSGEEKPENLPKHFLHKFKLQYRHL